MAERDLSAVIRLFDWSGRASDHFLDCDDSRLTRAKGREISAFQRHDRDSARGSQPAGGVHQPPVEVDTNHWTVFGYQ
jgi:hypothetical protein